jgi:Fur family transcriptional regulator, ferric uptake regulator
MRSSSVSTLILKTLAQDKAHLTVQQIYEQIRHQLPAVNPSTVYRALERLAHEELVSVSDIGRGAAVYEAVGGECHHHLVCQTCGQIQTISDEAISRFFNQIEQEHQYQIITNHLVLFGRCHACTQKLSKEHSG